MLRIPSACLVGLWCACSAVAALAQAGGAAEEKQAEGQFIRVVADEAGDPQTLETSVVRYALPLDSGDELVVDLIGVIHIGDAQYYAELNELFRDYDALLYELVAPEENAIPQSEEGASLLGNLQGGMGHALGLEFQLDHIDYTADNFVHADMSPEEFARSMEERNESFLSMFFEAMQQQAAQEEQSSGAFDLSGFLSFFNEEGQIDPQRVMRSLIDDQAQSIQLMVELFQGGQSFTLKKMMAAQMAAADDQMALFNGPDGSTIITERNKVALHELLRQIALGKRRLGVFYGAGHMADMEVRLLEEFGFERRESRWLVAWNMRRPAEEAAGVEKLPMPPKE